MPSSLIDLVPHRSRWDADRPAFAFLSYSTAESASVARMTFGDLGSRARAVAAALQQRCTAGDRVVILCQPGLDYVLALHGCILARLVAVPAYPPRNARHWERLTALLTDAQASGVITTSDVAGRVGAWAGDLPQPPWRLEIDTLDLSRGGDWVRSASDPDALAVLQYTSGTTGAPKGVMIGGTQLLANIERIVRSVALGPQSVGVLWLPPFHDMGLVAGLLANVYAGSLSVLMSPAAFLQRPSRWLRAITTFKATHTCSPNFGYALASEAVVAADTAALDLSTVEVAMCGAEVVRPQTLSRFAQRFEPSGFRTSAFLPAYGLAESVVMVSCARPGTGAQFADIDRAGVTDGLAKITSQPGGPAREPGASKLRVTSSGVVIPDHDLKIVSADTSLELAPGEVGEIWLSGPSVASGYWRNETETQRTFGARLRDQARGQDTQTYLRTGDLGAVIDGQLYVLGRLKDMIIVRGRNHLASDLEASAARAHPALETSRIAAVAMDESDAEHLVIVAEPRRSALRGLDVAAIFQAVRSAILSEHEIDPMAIVLSRPNSLPRTSSDKLRRGAIKDALAAGTLAIVAEWRASSLGGQAVDAARSRGRADAIIAWVRNYAREDIDSFEFDERRSVPPVLVQDFARMGLFGLRVPEDHGGLALSYRDVARIGEQIAAIDPMLMTMLGQHNVLAMHPILNAGSLAMQQRILPELAAGRGFLAFALTEPGAGSNPRAIQSVARADGSGRWRLNGQKSWVGLGGWARYVVVTCRLEDENGRSGGHGMFVVERGTTGFRVGPESLTLGLRGFPKNTLFFDDVVVDEAALVGQPGEGMRLALSATAIGRLSLAAICLGCMKRAAQLMVRYAQRRRIGSGLLLENGVTRDTLDSVLAHITAIETFLDHGCGVIDSGKALPDDFYSVAKLSAPEFLWDAVDALVQMLGGRGYEEPNEAARMLRDARVLRIGEGPTETIGVYLGSLLLAGRGDLLNYLGTALEADHIVERIERNRSEVARCASSQGRSWNETEALALSRIAMRGVLLALLQRRISIVGSSWRLQQAAAILGEELTLAEASLARACGAAPSNSDQLAASVEELAATIGDIDRHTSGRNDQQDHFLRRDPDVQSLVSTLHEKNLARFRDGLSVEPHAEQDQAFVGELLLLVREIVAEVLGIPLNAVAPDTALDALGLDSLRAVQLVARLSEATGIDLPPSAPFDHPCARALAEALDRGDAAGTAAIPLADRSAPLPLSSQQQRLWFLSRLSSAASAAYNITAAFHVSGALDTQALRAALEDLVARHEGLRARFVAHQGQPMQYAAEAFCVAGQDASVLPAEALAGRLAELADEPFDLDGGPLFRAAILKRGEREHILVGGGHHTVLDGWSVGILLRDLAALYEARLRGNAAELPRPAISHLDYAAWQAALPTARFERALAFWRDTLRGAPTAISLPFDRPRPGAMDFMGESVEFRVEGTTVHGLRALARSRGATLFVVLQAALAALLHRLGGGDDLVIGTAVAGRERAELEPVVGFFANTVALRHRLQPDMTISALIDSTRKVVLGALDHVGVPFRDVIAATGTGATLSHPPLAQVMLVLQNQAEGELASALHLPGVRVTPLHLRRSHAQFELDLEFVEDGEELKARLTYATALFDHDSALRIARQLTRVLDAFGSAPDQLLSAIPLLSAAERDQIVYGFNDRVPAEAAEHPVLAQVAQQAAHHPDAIAIEDGRQSLSYGALLSAARRLGRHLISLGVGPEIVVGVCLGQSAAVTALLGVFEAGGAVLLLDPDLPDQRLGFMLDDALASVVVTTREHAPRLCGERGGERTLVVLDDAATAAALTSRPTTPITEEERRSLLTPESLAYVLFTSGSTGAPKGVLIEQRSLANLVATIRDLLGARSGDVVISAASPSFDVVIEEFCLGLVLGGRLVLADRQRLLEPNYLGRLVEETGATVLEATPTLLAAAMADGWRPPPTLRVLLGGEVLPWQTANQARAAGATVWNVYGPTETTVSATAFLVPSGAAAMDGGVPIGRPLPGVQAYVVDDRLEPQPVGVAGELLIGGVQVARGYHRRPELTEQSFIADPFLRQPGGRLYRTGDLARWRADGTLEFLGRTDQQVKIRGMRVEPGEVEAALATMPGVAAAAVVARPDAQGNASLLAFVVPDMAATDAEGSGRRDPRVIRIEPSMDLATVHALLQQHVPKHMVPSGYVGLSCLPLLPSGKVDRLSLPAAEIERPRAGYVAPCDDVETLCCQVMREVVSHDRLDLERVGVDDNFFELGGHSILAAQYAVRLGAALNRQVPVRLIFEAPTVRLLLGRLNDLECTEGQPALTRADRFKPIPASFEQQRMWVLNEVHGHLPVYNEGLPILFRGPMDTSALVRTVQALADRYEVLRTRILNGPDGLIQVIDPPGDLTVAFEDWTGGATQAELLARARDRATTLLAAPYDLSRSHPCRMLVAKLRPDLHLWCFATHHIVGDNWSLSHVMPGDFVALYEAFAAGQPPRLAPIELHYADYAAWQRTPRMEAVRRDQLAYWRERLRDAPRVLDFGADRPRPPVRTMAGRQIATQGFTMVEWQAIERFAVARHATPFIVFQAALACLLARLARSDDVVIGTPHVARPHAALWPEFGYFGNTLALRTAVSPGESFVSLFDRLREQTQTDLRHHDVPFEAIVHDLALRPSNHAPLFQVMLVMHAFLDRRHLEFGDVRADVLDAMPRVAKYDLTFDVNPGATGVGLNIEYACDIFDGETVAHIGQMYRHILLAALAAPELPIRLLAVMDAGERERVVTAFNRTEILAAPEQTPLSLFEACARNNAGAVAVTDEVSSISYEALECAANRLGRQLITLGVGPEQVVGVCLDRSVAMVTAFLSVFKAGGAVLPLDPDLPQARLDVMLAEAGATLLITTRSGASAFAGGQVCGRRLALLDDEAFEAAVASRPSTPITDTERHAPLSPANLAYVLFTSGSTGRPKGVMVEQRSLAALIAAMRARFGADAARVVLSTISQSFDVLWEELFVPLTSGGRVILADRGRLPEPGYVNRLVERSQVTSVTATPTMLRAIMAAGWRPGPGVQVILGGEVLPSKLARSVQSCGATVWNVYGPTEATIIATAYQVPPAAGGDAPVPIGRPLASTRIYVVDDQLEPLPSGVTGELVIGGAQVARGYIGRPELTAERFVVDPFSDAPGARLYRTGDLARWRPDGRLEFIGRADEQVKIRGMRVELGEVEAALAALPGVKAAVASVQTDAKGETRLVAYLVPLGSSRPLRDLRAATADAAPIHVPLDGVLDLQELRVALRSRLPEPMVPSAFIGLEHLPRTLSDKLDRKALPAADAEVSGAGYVQPRTPNEHLVATIFAELLRLDRVGAPDDFFALGGDSFSAIALTARLSRSSGRTLPTRAVFDAPTVEQLANALDHAGSPAYEPLEPLHRGAPRSAIGGAHNGHLFCLHDISGHCLPYRHLAPRLASVSEVVGVRALGLQPGEAPFTTYGAMCSTYADAIRKKAPEGPIHLLGWSFGGFLAHDLACRLLESGRLVPRIVLLDCVDEPETRRVPDFADWVKTARQELERRLGHPLGAAAADDHLALAYGHLRLLAERPPSLFYSGRTLIVRASDTRARVSNRTLGWQHACGSFDIIDVPFPHLHMLDPEPARVVGDEINRWLSD